MGVSGYVPEVGSAQEISFQVTGGLGEAATGGPQMNLIPREGGNSFSGTMFFNYAGDGWQGGNLNDEQRALGLREINKLVKTWDINPMFGGPIKRERVWFFVTARHFYTENTVAGIFLNRNAATPPSGRTIPATSRRLRQRDEERQPPSDVAGLAPEQGVRVVGRAGDLSTM